MVGFLWSPGGKPPQSPPSAARLALSPGPLRREGRQAAQARESACPSSEERGAGSRLPALPPQRPPGRRCLSGGSLPPAPPRLLLAAPSRGWAWGLRPRLLPRPPGGSVTRSWHRCGAPFRLAPATRARRREQQGNMQPSWAQADKELPSPPPVPSPRAPPVSPPRHELASPRSLASHPPPSAPAAPAASRPGRRSPTPN